MKGDNTELLTLDEFCTTPLEESHMPIAVASTAEPLCFPVIVV